MRSQLHKMKTEKDFVKEIGYLGFTMRLKRISDAMMHEGRKLYAELDLDIEPNWYIIFKLLKKYNKLNVTEIADKLMLAHPSVIAITNKMIKTGYLKSSQSTEDTRKRVLELSKKAIKNLPEYEKIWKAGEDGIIKALKNIDGMMFLEEMENRYLYEKGFKQRTLEELKK